MTSRTEILKASSPQELSEAKRERRLIGTGTSTAAPGCPIPGLPSPALRLRRCHDRVRSDLTQVPLSRLDDSSARRSRAVDPGARSKRPSGASSTRFGPPACCYHQSCNTLGRASAGEVCLLPPAVYTRQGGSGRGNVSATTASIALV